MTGTYDRRFSTADLENLTESITPGPWVNDEHELGPFWGDSDGRPGSNNPADEEALAALPELAAELLRVRTELEERIRIWQRVAEKMDSNGDTDVGDAMRYMIRNITRILNGDDQ